MTSSFLSTSFAPRVNLHILRRDYFDGFGLLLQDEDGEPFDLSEVQVCASVWKTNGANGLEFVETINVQEEEPLRSGRVRLWLTSAQTNNIWTAAGNQNIPGGSFFPNAYQDVATVAPSSPLIWDVRIEKEEAVADLVSVAGGAFISQTSHGLASSERVIFRDTTQSSINYNNTSARVYSGLTDISYVPPYSFTIPTLSGVTNAAVGGSVYRLRQDTVVTGSVIVGTTLSNCFP
jgi:hypothetical protein